MTVMVPMPVGVILHPKLISDRKHWWACVKIAWRNKRQKQNFIKAFRLAVWSVNHGTKHNGDIYRSCYRLRAFELEGNNGK